jgi:hypothetical protein
MCSILARNIGLFAIWPPDAAVAKSILIYRNWCESFKWYIHPIVGATEAACWWGGGHWFHTNEKVCWGIMLKINDT